MTNSGCIGLTSLEGQDVTLRFSDHHVNVHGEVTKRLAAIDYTAGRVVQQVQLAAVAIALRALQSLPAVGAQLSVNATCSVVCSPAPANTYGQVLSGGIQDISAVAGLLGTEACANHLLNSVAGGYLYATTQPWSMLGSLGSAKAALYCVVPLKFLRRAGFTAWGPLLGRLAENELDSVPAQAAWLAWKLPPLEVEGPTASIRAWLLMAAASSVTSTLGVLPFLWPLIAQWSPVYSVFPLLRVFSSWVTSLLVPWYLSMVVLARAGWYMVIVRVVLAMAAAGTLVGYIGSFAYIQQFSDERMSYVWVALEAFLAAVRACIWAVDPSWDNLGTVQLACKPDPATVGTFELPMLRGRLPTEGMFVFGVCPAALVSRMRVHAGLPVYEGIDTSICYHISEHGNPQLLVVGQGGFTGPELRHIGIIFPLFSFSDGLLRHKAWVHTRRGSLLASMLDVHVTGMQEWLEQERLNLQVHAAVFAEYINDQGVCSNAGFTTTLTEFGDLTARLDDKVEVYAVHNLRAYSESCGCRGCRGLSTVPRLSNKGYGVIHAVNSQGKAALRLRSDDIVECGAFGALALLTVFGFDKRAIAAAASMQAAGVKYRSADQSFMECLLGALMHLYPDAFAENIATDYMRAVHDYNTLTGVYEYIAQRHPINLHVGTELCNTEAALEWLNNWYDSQIPKQRLGVPECLAIVGDDRAISVFRQVKAVDVVETVRDYAKFSDRGLLDLAAVKEAYANGEESEHVMMSEDMEEMGWMPVMGSSQEARFNSKDRDLEGLTISQTSDTTNE